MHNKIDTLSFNEMQISCGVFCNLAENRTGVWKSPTLEYHGGGYFEALFAFVVGLVSLTRKVCTFGLQKNILMYPFNGTLSENGSRNCFGQNI